MAACRCGSKKATVRPKKVGRKSVSAKPLPKNTHPITGTLPALAVPKGKRKSKQAVALSKELKVANKRAAQRAANRRIANCKCAQPKEAKKR